MSLTTRLKRLETRRQAINPPGRWQQEFTLSQQEQAMQELEAWRETQRAAIALIPQSPPLPKGTQEVCA